MKQIFRRTGSKIVRQAGFTLVELLIVMGLLSILLISLTDMFVSVLDVQTESEGISAVSQDGRYILSRLSYDVERATSITTPATLGGSGATLAIVIGAVTNTYTIASGNLQLTNGAGTDVLNGSESTISAFTVQRIGNVSGKDTIRLSFTVTGDSKPDRGPQSRTFTTAVGRK